MEKVYPTTSLLYLLLLLLANEYTGVCEAADVSATVCTVAGTECSAITNSFCDKVTLKCKCVAFATETGATCTVKLCGSAAVCTALDTNSECSGSNALSDTCRCVAATHLMGNEGKCSKKCTQASDCTGTDSNSECSGTGSTDKCRCKTGYSLGSAGTCVLDVTSIVCSAGGTQCNTITNALCDTSALKCKCGDIFMTNANTCIGKTCSAATTCTVLDANSECTSSKCQCKSTHLMGNDGKCALSCSATTTCTALDANSECTSNKCLCKSTYLMGNDGKCALQCTTDAACTTNDPNSKCSGNAATDKCKCNTGFTMGIDGKCKSGAAAVLVSVMMLLTCFITTLA